MKKIHPKMNALEWSQHFSNFKSMWIFHDAQEQLTPQLEVWSCKILNPSQILWLSLLTARMRKIHSKIKALEWSQDYSFIFKRSRAAYSVVGRGILMKFKLIQAFKSVLITCKNKEDRSKNECVRVVTTFLQF